MNMLYICRTLAKVINDKWPERASVNQRVVSAYLQPETFRLDPGSRNVNQRLCAAVKYLPYLERSSFRLSSRPSGVHIFGKQDRSRGSQKSAFDLRQLTGLTRVARGFNRSGSRGIFNSSTRSTDLVMYICACIQSSSRPRLATKQQQDFTTSGRSLRQAFRFLPESSYRWRATIRR